MLIKKQIEGVSSTGGETSPTISLRRNSTTGTHSIGANSLFISNPTPRSATIIGAITGGRHWTVADPKQSRPQKDWKKLHITSRKIVGMDMFMDWLSGWLRGQLIGRKD